VSLDDRIGLDLDQHGWIDERPDLHHGGGRRVSAEGLTVCSAVLGPPGDVGHEHPGPDHVREVRAQRLEGTTSDFEAPEGLRGGVPGRVDPSTLRDGSRASHVNV